MKCSCLIADYPVHRFSMPVIDSSMYAVLAGTSCLIVDPCVSEEAEALLLESGVRDCTVLLTHEHYDHISGVNWLRERMPCQVICSEACAGRIRDPRKNAAAYFSAMFLQRGDQEQARVETLLEPRYACEADRTFSGALELTWQGLRLTMTETPGHSPGSQIIEIGKHWYFTGDSLIPGQAIITRLPGGSRTDYDAITRPYLSAITPGSILFPGHGAETVFSGQLE